ncbi:MAG: biopolymer transporter ExbD [Bacteroidia bacterium]
MGKFNKDSKRALPAISTASLPDIIFILLFFFMVTTVLRDKQLLVKQQLPSATEIEKLEKKSLVSYIYIGPPRETDRYGTAPRIQLNDAFAPVSQVQSFVLSERRQRDERMIPFMTFSLKVDKTTRMGLVTDVKQELREVQQLKINYSTVVAREDE